MIQRLRNRLNWGSSLSLTLISLLTAGATTSTALALGGMGLPAFLALGLGVAGAGGTVLTALSGDGAPRELESSVAPLALKSELPEGMGREVAELHQIAAIYERRESPLFAAVNGVLTNVQELFRRMVDLQDGQSAKLAAVRYEDLLSKLNRALGEKYYLDLEANPELWSNREERMGAVETALNATGEQIIRNIRQLNGSRDLEYQLSIGTLIDLGNES